MNEQDPSPLDDFLRTRFQAFQRPPSPQVWEGIAQRLQAQPPGVPPRMPRAWVVGLAVVVGVVVGWLLRTPAPAPGGGFATMLRPGNLPGQRTVPAGTRANLAASKTAPLTRAAAPVGVAANEIKVADGKSVTQPLAARAPRSQGPLHRVATVRPAAQRSPRLSLVPPVSPAVSGASAGSVAAPATAPAAGSAPAVTGPPVSVSPDALADSLRNPKIESRSLVVDRTVGLAAGFTAYPTVLLGLADMERQLQGALADTAHAARARARAALLAQQTELARLRLRTDSLLFALTPTAQAAADSAAAPGVTPKKGRWSVALAFTPERDFFGLRSVDTLAALRRTHETGRAGFNASFTAEYLLTPRLSVGAGVGLSSYGAEMRLTDRQTLVEVRYDTVQQQTTDLFTSTNTLYSVRLDSLVQLSPRFNASGQVVNYDTVWVMRQDTIYTTILLSDTVRTTTRTISPHVTNRETVKTRILHPAYRFLTVPLLFRYRLTPDGATRGRWWADVAAGAQLQFFMGGSQLVSSDNGRSWQTQRVTARGGPFRPMTVAFTGVLAFNYGFTARLSMSLAPSLRWQPQSVYKAGTGLRQYPTAAGIQVGLRWAL